jgi:hypothetical protein
LGENPLVGVVAVVAVVVVLIFVAVINVVLYSKRSQSAVRLTLQ